MGGSSTQTHHQSPCRSTVIHWLSSYFPTDWKKEAKSRNLLIFSNKNNEKYSAFACFSAFCLFDVGNTLFEKAP
jgi:hypothetical protein